ncbi:hypothetical protein GGI12_000979 [Dipsacomyces acuminosporus]|nr:hypothetical protein GGI12_000979 [Dipsacomyces acuminosporus]
MVLSDLFIVYRAAKNIAGLAVKEQTQSIGVHLKTSSLVPRAFAVPQALSTAAETAAETATAPAPAPADGDTRSYQIGSDSSAKNAIRNRTELYRSGSVLATRLLPIALHPGPLDRAHLLLSIEHRPHTKLPKDSIPQKAQRLVIEEEKPSDAIPETQDMSISSLHKQEPAAGSIDHSAPAESTDKEHKQQKIEPTRDGEKNTAFDENPSHEQAEIAAARLQPSRMPANRVSRLYHYGSLAVGLGLGALGEATKRWSGFGQSDSASEDSSKSLLLTRGNIGRIVAKLSKMRGAALKLGQMLSIQDSKDMSPEIAEVLQRVQNSANCLPISQVDKTMRKQLGSQWRDSYESFSDEPFAAASIGQVHEARMNPQLQSKHGFAKVAVKVQYPGVADSIESDLNNLQSLLVMSKLLPRGMYLENTIKVARKELAWECDYAREADAMVKFGELLADDPDFVVPRFVSDLSSKMVLTAEFMDGLDMRKLESLDQETRDYIGTCIMRLCLRELFEFEFMQTDPNWANFLFNPETRKIVLLDFGASRGFGKEFLDKYLMMLKSSMDGDREGCRHWSTELGFLTGYEADVMTQAHVDSVLEIGKPFRESGVYDFGNQDVSSNVRSAIPVMLRHRLTPPPNETYSLHRKLSGAYLLCIRLRARVPCQALFKKIASKYTFGDGAKLQFQ